MLGWIALLHCTSITLWGQWFIIIAEFHTGWRPAGSGTGWLVHLAEISWIYGRNLADISINQTSCVRGMNSMNIFFMIPLLLLKCLLGERTSWSSLMAGSVISHQRLYAKWAQVTARANFLFPLPLTSMPSGKFCMCTGSLVYWSFTPDLS